jgi:hypothetical protein
MAVIISDIHGSIIKVQKFLAYEPQEQHICLGDIVDSRGRNKLTMEEELACLDLLLNSPTILLWGNHDLAYLPERPWRCYGNFGEMAFRDRYQTARSKFSAACAADGWLCTHAGVSPKLAKLIPASVIAGGAESIAEWLCVEFERELIVPDPDVLRGEPRYGKGPLFQIPVCRGGHHEYGGIFWHDAGGEQRLPSLLVRQVFGHSPDVEPVRGDTWINLDTYDGEAWIYNTKTDAIVSL